MKFRCISPGMDNSLVFHRPSIQRKTPLNRSLLVHLRALKFLNPLFLPQAIMTKPRRKSKKCLVRIRCPSADRNRLTNLLRGFDDMISDVCRGTPLHRSPTLRHLRNCLYHQNACSCQETRFARTSCSKETFLSSKTFKKTSNGHPCL